MQDTETTRESSRTDHNGTGSKTTGPAALIDAGEPEAAVEAAYDNGYADGQADAYQSPASVDHPAADGGDGGSTITAPRGADMATSESNAVTPAADGDQAAADLIADVATLVNGDRDSHGDAVDQQATAADYWTIYLRSHGLLTTDAEVAGSDVARMMALLKISRGGVVDTRWRLVGVGLSVGVAVVVGRLHSGLGLAGVDECGGVSSVAASTVMVRAG